MALATLAKIRWHVLLQFSIIACSGFQARAAPSGVGETYYLYHKLGNDSNFTPRGSVDISLDGENGLVVNYHQSTASQLDTAAFDTMVDADSLYTLAVVDGEDNMSSSSHYVSASVPGCSLRRSNLREEIGLTISPTGKILSVYYRPIISPVAKTCDKLMPLSQRPDAVFGRKDEHAMPFKTTVSFDFHKSMMVIPTVLPQQKPPPGLKWYRRNAKNNPTPLLSGSKVEGGIPGVDSEEPGGFKSSFLYRYWYIVLPLALMGLFGGVEEEEAAKQPQAGVAVPARGVNGQAKQRRGKRD